MHYPGSLAALSFSGLLLPKSRNLSVLKRMKAIERVPKGVRTVVACCSPLSAIRRHLHSTIFPIVSVVLNGVWGWSVGK